MLQVWCKATSRARKSNATGLGFCAVKVSLQPRQCVPKAASGCWIACALFSIQQVCPQMNLKTWLGLQLVSRLIQILLRNQSLYPRLKRKGYRITEGLGEVTTWILRPKVCKHLRRGTENKPKTVHNVECKVPRWAREGQRVQPRGDLPLDGFHPPQASCSST